MQATDNSSYLRELLTSMFVSSFPNLTPSATRHMVDHLFDSCRDIAAFKQHLRDFLVSLKEFGSGEDLFTEEREAELARKVRARAAAPPCSLRTTAAAHERAPLRRPPARARPRAAGTGGRGAEEARGRARHHQPARAAGRDERPVAARASSRMGLTPIVLRLLGRVQYRLRDRPTG